MSCNTEKVRLSELSVGEFVQITGFTCIADYDTRLVLEDDKGNLYIDCAEGSHKLDGQTSDFFGLDKVPEGDHPDTLVGVERVVSIKTE